MIPVTLTPALVRRLIPKRPPESHKGSNGHVLVLAGSRGMSGAAVLAAHGALRIGAGLVTVAIVQSERSLIGRHLPEALTLPLPETPEGCVSDSAESVLQDYFRKRKVTAYAIGPGLSVAESVKQLLKWLLAEGLSPAVLDADGLNNLTPTEMVRRSGLVITPHPGEFAKLVNGEIAADSKARQEGALRLAEEIQGVCVLKGHETVISDGRRIFVNPTGNPAMATGGMGDVLTGVIAGLLAQDLNPLDAACAGVFLHGLAGDLSRVADRGLLASDLAEALPRALAKVGLR